MVVQSADPRAWSAATVDDIKRWYFPLPQKLLSDLRTVVAAQPAEKPLTDILNKTESGHSGARIFGSRFCPIYKKMRRRNQRFLCGKCVFFDRERVQHPGGDDFPYRRRFL